MESPKDSIRRHGDNFMGSTNSPRLSFTRNASVSAPVSPSMPVPSQTTPLPPRTASHPQANATVRVDCSTSTTVSNTVKLLSELERSWAMFSANWRVVDLFAGLQIWQEQIGETGSGSEPLNNVLLSTASAGLVTFLAGHIGGGGFFVSLLLTLLVVTAALWTLSDARAKTAIPCFKTLQVVDGSPSEIFMYLMCINNYPIWDASVEKAEVVHTIDDHSDIIHIIYRPVWMWPVWLTPRDLCLLRYWRRAEDGSYVICMQSALHPECPPMDGLVRATCKGGGFIISPSVTQLDEMTSMVTNVIHLDPQGWEGNLLQRLNMMHLYVRPQVLSVTGLRDVMEARKYVCPNVPEEFSAALASSTEEQYGKAASQEEGAGGGTIGDPEAPVSMLEDFPSNVPRTMWAEPDGAAMMVRGPDYLTDRRKIPSQSPFFRLVGMDLFESSEVIEHIASRADNTIQRELRRHEERGTEMPFTFIVNFVVPGTPRINLVLYYQVPHPSVLTDGSPSSELMADFLNGSDEFRNERFKLIPCIVEGSFIVRQAVGSTPSLVGKKLRQPYHRGKQYFELDVDIGSSAVANRVVGLVSGYTKKLVIDMGFVLEGQNPDELPERLFGTCRLVHIDLSVAKKLT
ncbi:START-like domain [Plasmopara halstedii]|uniref:START-like domain n=1 Tax=Plasmopara halstedii TaxID=4781 RepID=A0A0P1ARH6_PLAHL|nr:START-like domain [Plasmopara halstedii]CEG44159.1 START-like domain [Plasmopara halstedii]|eukprot:XP_024580528.1 START-like domain [Plasmopara halstedii]